MRLAVVQSMHPFELSHDPPESFADRKDPTVLLDRQPFGPAERAGALMVAQVQPVPRSKTQVRLRLVDTSGRAMSFLRRLTETDRLPAGVIAFLPFSGVFWGAFLAIPEQQADRPWEVERLFWQLDRRHRGSHGGRAMPESKGWAIAWSIYCKHVARKGDPHCRRPKQSYLTGECGCRG